MGIDEIGAQRNGAAIMLLGVRLSAGQFEHRGQIEMRDRRIRRAFQDQFELHQRFIEASQRPQSPPEIVASLDISGIERHRPFEAGQCIRKQSVGRENHAPVVVRLGEIRIERHGPADKRRRIGASQLMRDHSQQVKRARILWIGIADQPVEPLGVDQTAGAMMSHRGCERLLGTAPGIHGDISKTKAAA